MCHALSFVSPEQMEFISEECGRRTRREYNIFVTGLPEASTTSAEVAVIKDQRAISELLEVIDATDARVKEFRRIGGLGLVQTANVLS